MARIVRKEVPPKYYSAHRKYLEYLRRDFKDRCAYSMQHVERAGGWTAMEIDHHDPNLPDGKRNDYKNLFLSTKHCNGHKLGNWPTNAEKQAGKRFLNPCVEHDYGLHIFEDPNTFQLWGHSRAGRYHIRYMDLNADHLVKERKKRHELRLLWEQTGVVQFAGRPVHDDAITQKWIKAGKEEMDLMILPIVQKVKPAFPTAAPIEE